MEDELVENNLANDDWNAGTGTYDELEVDNDNDVGSEPNDTPYTDEIAEEKETLNN